MSSVNISIRNEAYRFLRSLKSGDKSFSDVILEFKEKKGNKENILRLFDAERDMNINWEEKKKTMNNFRKSFNKRIKETTKYMENGRNDRNR